MSSLQLTNALFYRQNIPHFRNSRNFHVSATYSENGVKRVSSAAKSASLKFEEARERITKLIREPEISVSTYDTAWVAMVASPHSEKQPCFPDCLNWLLENQCPDGSWALPHHHSLSLKDVISSTLACILALKRWGVGEDQINRGIRFIELNFSSASEKNQIAPIGFDIIFSSMLDYARDLSLNLDLEPTALNDLNRRRNWELKRCYQSDSHEMKAYMAYISEGMGKLMEWNSIMKHQRRNGSLFNSLSTTAAACIFHHNDRCLDYLHLALNKSGNAVPAVYPISLYAQLCTVDNLERSGISRYFMKEIQNVLDEAYRYWLEDNEDLIADASSCALSFKLLRQNGYVLNSDKLIKAVEGDFLGGEMRDVSRTLELYRASELIFPNETALEKQNMMLKNSLELELSAVEFGRNIDEEVKQALNYPSYAIMERMAVRKNIEQYNVENATKILKTSFSSSNFADKDFSFLSVADFNQCQQVHREEYKELERWVVNNRLEEMKFARRKSAYCYFSAAATIFSPELPEARMSWAKNAVLATVVDDFFDVGGSFEEFENLIQLLKKWDVNPSTECLSGNVEILFSALKSTISDIGEIASIRQERSVTKHIIHIWLDLLNSMLKEAEWVRDGSKPLLDEYLSSASISLTLGSTVLPALYLLGPKISEDMVQHPEYNHMFQLMNTCGRLLNDIQTYEREMKQSKLNAVPLYMIHCGGAITEEAAIAKIKRVIDCQRRELQGLVLEGKNSVLPRVCRELFWHMSTVVHLFYIKDDGFTSEDLIKAVNNIIHEPIVPNQM